MWRFKRIQAEAIRAVASVKRKRIDKDDGVIVSESEYKLWDKLQAILLLGKKLRLFVDKVEIENPQDAAYRELLAKLQKGEI